MTSYHDFQQSSQVTDLHAPGVWWHAGSWLTPRVQIHMCLNVLSHQLLKLRLGRYNPSPAAWTAG